MQRGTLAALLIASSVTLGASLKVVAATKESPVAQVVTLLHDLKASIEADGQAETVAYDKYACWCEDTLAQKAGDISAAKEKIGELESAIVKLRADIASLTEELKQVNKDIAENEESQQEASQMREKEAISFDESKVEAEQCLSALEAAIKVMTGAGAKKGFLETFQEAQVLSVVAGVRGLLTKPMVSKSLKADDLALVRRFVDRPEDFVGGRTSAMSAAQIAKNPFGDYAPQSGQIQGILKGMYDSFMADLEKGNAAEATKQKAFEELMQTKKRELESLIATLQMHTTDHAAKGTELADSKSSLDDTKEQLAADEVFFSETKDTCKQRAGHWAERVRLRTEELHGIAQAVAVLSSEDAKKTFENATSTFLQVFSSFSGPGAVRRGIAYEHLSAAAKETKSVALAKLAVAVKTGGHFNKIINMVDNMVVDLREEEQQDVKEKKWCDDETQKRKWSMEDLDRAISKAQTAVERHGLSIEDLTAKITEYEGAVTTTETALAEMKALRIGESDAFLQAQRDDAAAIKLLEKAIAQMSKFFEKQGIQLELLGEKTESKVDPQAKPELGWEKEGGQYGGRHSESEGIVAILSMIKEDLERELETSGVSDGEGQANYGKDTSALRETLQAQMEGLQQARSEKANLERKVADLDQLKASKNSDLDAEKESDQAVATKCAWVASHFDMRRSERKVEIDGLINAKAYLMGADSA